jgi:SAM-dependent methyltransferase
VSDLWTLGRPATPPYRLFDALRRCLNARLVEYFARRVRARRALEAGSGPGFASSLMNGLAMDIDIEALKEGRRRSPDLRAVVGDVYAMPFRSASFDLVWNSSTLEHLADFDRALAEMARLVPRNGHVFVGVPYRWGPLGFQTLIRRTRLGVWLGDVFSRRELSIRFRRAHLRPVDTRLYFFHFFVGVLACKI